MYVRLHMHPATAAHATQGGLQRRVTARLSTQEGRQSARRSSQPISPGSLAWYDEHSPLARAGGARRASPFPKGPVSKRTLLIGLIVVIAGLGIWRFVAGRVDRSKPEAVAAAFFAALKSNNLSKASGYWVPDGADAWRTSASDKIEHMQSGSYARFFEDLPDTAAVYTGSRRAGAPASEQTMTASSGPSLDVRQIDGKWYVCRSPL